MKKFFLFSIVLLALASCSNKPKYVVSGTISDVDSINGKRVVVYNLLNKDDAYRDTVIVKKDAFTFKGKVADPAVLMGSVLNTNLNNFVFVVEEGKITIDLNKEGATLGGTPLNEKFQQFNQKYDSLNQALVNMYQDYISKRDNGSLTEEETEKYMQERPARQKEMRDFIVDSVEENIDNALGEYFFFTYYFLMDAENQERMRGFAPQRILDKLNS